MAVKAVKVAKAVKAERMVMEADAPVKRPTVKTDAMVITANEETSST